MRRLIRFTDPTHRATTIGYQADWRLVFDFARSARQVVVLLAADVVGRARG